MTCVPTKIHTVDSLTSPCKTRFRTGHKIGKGDFGTTYEACCGDQCSQFIEKYQPRTLDEAEEDLLSVRQEILYQQMAARFGLAPRVIELRECRKGSAFIMERLDATLKDDLNQLSSLQLETAHKEALRVVTHYLPIVKSQSAIHPTRQLETEELLEGMLVYLEEEQFANAEEIWQFQQALVGSLEPMFPLDKDNYAQPWIPEDDEEQQQDRIIRMALVIQLVKRLQHGPKLCHNDAHPGNIMRRGEDIMDLSTHYEWIDFGQSEPLTSTNNMKDLDRIQSSLVDNVLDEPVRPYLTYLPSWVQRLIPYITHETSASDLRNPDFYTWVFSDSQEDKLGRRKKKRSTQRKSLRKRTRTSRQK